MNWDCGDGGPDSCEQTFTRRTQRPKSFEPAPIPLYKKDLPPPKNLSIQLPTKFLLSNCPPSSPQSYKVIISRSTIANFCHLLGLLTCWSIQTCTYIVQVHTGKERRSTEARTEAYPPLSPVWREGLKMKPSWTFQDFWEKSLCVLWWRQPTSPRCQFSSSSSSWLCR